MTGTVHLEVVLGALGLAGAYVAAWRAADEPARPARAIAFGLGLALALAALNGPLHDLAERGQFSAHMLQHLLLTLVVPPLVLAGVPPFMADAGLGRLRACPLVHAALGAATRPLPAMGAWSVVLFAWHLPAPYAAALASPLLHVGQHACLVAGALLAWWPIASPSRVLPALPYAARLLYLFAFGMPMTIVAAMITGADGPLYPGVDLGDQRLGGVLMWVPSAIVPVVTFTAVFFRWASEESDEPSGYPE